MMKKFNNFVKFVMAGVFMVLLYIADAGIAGEIFKEYDFDESILAGFVNIIKDFGDHDGYMMIVIFVSMIYTTVKVTKYVVNVHKKLTNKDIKAD